ncbi:MAG: electron transport complex protein RnfC, partial [Deltaproteobacteria bacterium]
KKPPERQLHQTRAACLKCMLCTETCPRFLLGHRLYPDRLMRNLAAGISEDLPAFTGAYLCSECGLCAVYACVMGLDPCAANRMLKQRLSAAGVPRPEPLESPHAHHYAVMRKVPVRRLMARLGVVEFDRPAEKAKLDTGATRRLVLRLKQHAGAPAVPVVRKGARVSAGQPVAEPEGDRLGAVVHAPMAGNVVEIDQEAVVIDTGS